MSETIYIKETHEFLTENGHIVKEADLTEEEITQMKSECSQVNRLFGNSDSDDKVIKG
jgi:hypothetical protein